MNTPRHAAAMAAASRAVHYCTGLFTGGRTGLPADAYTPNGANGQYAVIVPSTGIIVVRRGLDRGAGFNITQFSADVIAALER